MQIPSNSTYFRHHAHKDGTNIASNKMAAEIAPPKVDHSTNKLAVNTSLTENDLSEVKSVDELSKVSKAIDADPHMDNEKMSELLDQVLTSINKDLAFSVDEDTGRNVVTISDAYTGDVIRQIPDEKMLDVLKQLAKNSSGLLDDQV